MADLNNNGKNTYNIIMTDDVSNNARRRVNRRRQHQNNPLLPNRPKRPMNAYNLHLKDYFRDYPHVNTNQARNNMEAASKHWNALTPEQKQTYRNLCQDDKTRYDHQMVKWNQQKRILKRPASAFALFLKNIWKQEPETARGVPAMGVIAGNQWKLMSEDDKNVYHQRSESLKEVYKKTIQKLNNGELNIDTMVEKASTNNNT